MSIRPRLAAVAAACALFAGSSSAQTPFTPGNLVIYRVGTGSAGLTNAATAAFLTEYTTTGGLVQPIPLPTTVSGSNLRATASGTATSEGLLTRSPDGRYLAFTGYDAALDTPGVAATAAVTVNRVAGIVGNDGVVNTSTATNMFYSGNSPRSAVTDGTTVWMSGTSGTAGLGGVVTLPVGTVGAGTQVSTTVTNTRAVNIFNGQLYVTSASGAFHGVSQVGTGTPTTSGNTITLLPGFSTTSGPSAYGFFFADANTLYVADDRSSASGGGLQKWTFNGSTWALVYTMNSGITTGIRGLTGTTDGAGNVVFYATTTETSANKLVTISDVIANTTASTSFTLLASAPTNTAFRGVAFAPTPVPEPGTVLALSAAGLGMVGLVRRRFPLPRIRGRG